MENLYQLSIVFVLVTAVSPQRAYLCNKHTDNECVCDQGELTDKISSLKVCTDLLTAEPHIEALEIAYPGCSEPEFFETQDAQLRKYIPNYAMVECNNNIRCGLQEHLNNESLVILRRFCNHSQPASLEHIIFVMKLNSSEPMQNSTVLPAKTMGIILETRHHLISLKLGSDITMMHPVIVVSTSFQQKKTEEEMFSNRSAIIVAIVLAIYVLIVWIISCVKLIYDRQQKQKDYQKAPTVGDEASSRNPEQRVLYRTNKVNNGETGSVYDNVHLL